MLSVFMDNELNILQFFHLQTLMLFLTCLTFNILWSIFVRTIKVSGVRCCFGKLLKHSSKYLCVPPKKEIHTGLK